MKLEFSGQIVENTQVLHLIRICPIQPSCSVGTDGRTGMTKLIVAFRNSATRLNRFIVFFFLIEAYLLTAVNTRIL
jgi:hypothetical protein